MAKYNLQPNEYQLHKVEGIQYGNRFSGYASDLVVTTLHIIVVVKNVFSVTTGVKYIPLNQIKVFDGKPQVAVVGRNGMCFLEVQLLNGQESFGIQEKKDAAAIAEHVSKTMTGNSHDTDSAQGTGIGVVGYAAGMLKSTLGAFGVPFGGEAKNQGNGKVARNCTSCSAPISGAARQVVRCQYCDSDQQL